MAKGLKQDLPFKIGQDIEVKSFITGYRGAWFRCKIKDIEVKRGQLGYYVEYYDFPDEKINWMRVYQNQTAGRPPRDNSKLELMIRPLFPLFHKESENIIISNTNKNKNKNHINDIKLVINDAWRVGDLVDLWCDKSYWSGKIKQFFSDGLVEVELPEAPIGEGGLYYGAIDDLRPTLNWSLQNGWSVPNSGVNEESWYAARIINTRDTEPILKETNTSCSNVASNIPIEQSNSSDESNSKSLHFVRNNTNKKARRNKTVLSDDDEALVSEADNSKADNNGTKETASCSNAVPKFPVKPSNSNAFSSDKSSSEPLHFIRNNVNWRAKNTIVLSDDDDDNTNNDNDNDNDNNNVNGDYDDYYNDDDGVLPSSCRKEFVREPDLIDGSIMQLEELACKIRWIKGVLKRGLSYSNDMKPTWKLLPKKL